MNQFKVSFDYQGSTRSYLISNPFVSDISNVLYINDERAFFRGQLIYSGFVDMWSFFENNGPNNQELADILGEYVVLWYQ